VAGAGAAGTAGDAEPTVRFPEPEPHQNFDITVLRMVEGKIIVKPTNLAILPSEICHKFLKIKVLKIGTDCPSPNLGPCCRKMSGDVSSSGRFVHVTNLPGIVLSWGRIIKKNLGSGRTVTEAHRSRTGRHSTISLQI
jgi:hypothetical protein